MDGNVIRRLPGLAFDEAEEIYRALVCGVRAYVEKNGFPGTLIGVERRH